MNVPLADQIVEVEGEVRQRVRIYPKWIEAKRLKPETAERKLAAMRAVQSTLIWLETNMDWIKAEAQRRREAARLAAEADVLRGEPAVQAVLEAFPDSTMTVTPGQERHHA